MQNDYIVIILHDPDTMIVEKQNREISDHITTLEFLIDTTLDQDIDLDHNHEIQSLLGIIIHTDHLLDRDSTIIDHIPQHFQGQMLTE